MKSATVAIVSRSETSKTMPASLVFLLKILIPSLLISIAIRRLAPSLGVVGTDLNATLAILIPPVVVAIGLGLRGWKSA